MSKSNNESCVWVVELFDDYYLKTITVHLKRKEARAIQKRIKKDHPELQTQVMKYIPDVAYDPYYRTNHNK